MFKNKNNKDLDLVRRVAALEGIYEAQRQHIKDLELERDTLVKIIDNLISSSSNDQD